MKQFVPLIFLAAIFIGCATKTVRNSNDVPISFHSVSIDTILKDKISIRAILIDNNTVWYAADKARLGYYDLNKNLKVENTIINEKLQPEFRSISQTSTDIFILSIGNPALLYKISKKDRTYKLVYQENDEKVFYDSMQFRNDKEGIAIGDPIKDCLSVITTHDGGNSWQKISCESLPKVADGEAAFAASNTNIIIRGNNTWIVTGGKKSRVFFSHDKGKTWEAFETPIVQGQSMTGIFTADFYDSNNGFIAGGSYEVPNQNFTNKARTADGGKTWQLIAENQAFGYASCIQYIPGSNAKQLVTVGTSGLYYSSDSGNTWSKLSDNKDLYTIRFVNKNTAIAAGRNIMVRIKFKLN